MGRGKQLAYALITAVSLSACSSKTIPPPSKPPMVEPIKAAKAEAAEKTGNTILKAKWKGGECSLDAGKMELTYATSRGLKRVGLDTDVLGIELKPEDLLCSSEFTVAIGEKYILVAVGQEQLDASFNMLGSIDGVFTASNSYYYKISKIREEGVESAFIMDSTLVLVTKKQVWQIDMRNPKTNTRTTEREDAVQTNNL
ncbi:hypothetical protein H0O02_00365 [Candidatus Micrarchaeota archaeon]|nr:hypothetical protein [Candidatus Micrarchaeota archaeon]